MPVTHPHPDHIEGLFSVVEKYEIDIIVTNGDDHRKRYWLNMGS